METIWYILIGLGVLFGIAEFVYGVRRDGIHFGPTERTQLVKLVIGAGATLGWMKLAGPMWQHAVFCAGLFTTIGWAATTRPQSPAV